MHKDISLRSARPHKLIRLSHTLYFHPQHVCLPFRPTSTNTQLVFARFGGSVNSLPWNSTGWSQGLSYIAATPSPPMP